jgi:hypothetical protein
MNHIDFKVCQTTATEAYKDRTMPDGSSMLEHCVRISNVFARMKCYEIAAVALLHEVLQSNILTAKELTKIGVFNPIIYASNFLVQREDETYIDYVVRVSQDKAAASILTADIAEHLMMSPTNLQYKQYQHGLLILSGWLPQSMMVDSVYDHLEVPKNMRGYGPGYEEN